jgi:protein subunit release factor B
MTKQLLFSLTKKDFTVHTFKGRGPGGQKRNKSDSCVRIIHNASGAKGECCEQKQQHQNKKIAFERLTKTKEFQQWHRFKAAMAAKGILDIEREVDKMMNPENLKIEYGKEALL